MKKTFLSGISALALGLAISFGAQAADIKQGGSMIVTYKDDVSTLDPAIGYDWQNWSMIKSLFDGLMDYEPGTTNLRKEIAEDYTISDDGKTFTFKLRKGVKFHNGRELNADDVKYSIERVVNPKTQSPGAGFFGSIVGFEDASAGKAEALSGITVVDPYTIKFELSRPDATFLHVLALNFAHIVPKEEVEKYGADFGKHPVGSGAFKMTEWTLGQRIVFERFKDYYNPSLPKLDQITFEVGQEPVVALLRLQNGEVDIPGDGIPPAKFIEVTKDPKFKDLIIQGGQLHTGYVTMNVKIKPFDNVKVRQAVNMAINKDRIVRIINGRAVPANQPLPPSMPGYAKDYKGYPYDPEKAKALLAEAGVADGFETELFVANTDPQPRIAQAIQQDLAAIGIKASIKSLAQANVIAAGGEPDGAPMVWSGGMGWIADFPDPSNFYGPILGCSGAVQGGWNWSWYCNAELDKKAQEADAIVDPARKEEREAMWRDIYLKIMDDAPWAPIFNEERFSVRSERLGGPDAIFVDPVHIPVNYDEVYAKDVQ
ncbi:MULTISPECIES: ABC transporter substrate-binding protein [Brucella/Ochrobactrum group]|jgi:peptide/nickel transport system substrate-binding protein|uniref:ABC transporter substrate-binding protein n=1 Tax=Brucella anthropi TaxID=529 RepID=A0A6I0DMA9_BRUAN|nr:MULTISPECIES: ABC transporter substrate-binding protein [Brucella/Ochrobactrum group]MBA8821269.1 peptide/nickel transport system substrate-binding protein [Ochrobactrum sp. P6BSIII]OOL15837.1 peptide ABC transporter substrate-binding protein [Ochrobactrum sp. P6BS-III]AIK44031.1 bacterial extracellular solute-binding s, 5 Middle family protein [Brucella anthropi]KAB2738703.1 ABC transporter substrate-binding protein [Brucella anthropi]KAB2746705.1 ABC transporter substrate-binding protein 